MSRKFDTLSLSEKMPHSTKDDGGDGGNDSDKYSDEPRESALLASGNGVVAVDADAAVAMEMESSSSFASSSSSMREKKCCEYLRFGKVAEARGYAQLVVAQGGIVMSNIFLSTALIVLASRAAGCDDHREEDENDDDDKESCANIIYGFRPTSLITNIALVSGLVSAFCLPVIGAIVDYTPHRRLVGIASAALITIVQGVQIWLTDYTWFVMAVLQAIAGFLYMVQLMAAYSYLPDIGRNVGPKIMARFSTLFIIYQFAAQVVYLLLNIVLAIGLGWVDEDVQTARLSQGICVVWLILSFVLGWRNMPPIPALRSRPEGKCLATIGFAQVWRTMRGINQHYGSGLRWYFLAVAFTEAGANAFTVVSVTFMVEVMQMNGTEVAIMFMISLLSALPGSELGRWISQKTNPVTSWKLNLIVFSVVTIASSFVLTGPSMKDICYAFGVVWGVLLGWYYTLELLIFSLCVPRGQESELSGFFTYCLSILTWLPPFIFTIINESGLHMKWGLMSLVIFLMVGCSFLQMMEPWEEILEAAKVNKITMPKLEQEARVRSVKEMGAGEECVA